MKNKLSNLLLVILLCPILAFAATRTENNFLVISDIHLDSSTTHQMEINPSQGDPANDLDQATFKKLLTDINVPKPGFIILLGDMVGHFRSTERSAPESESIVFNEIEKRFAGTPIFYVFGNNDSLKVNYGPFKDLSRPLPQSPYDIAMMTAGWKDGFLSTGTRCDKNTSFPCLIAENTDNGYYSAYLSAGFRLIALNSVQFSPDRKIVTEQDAFNQLKWLDEQLNLAKQKGDSVLIAMHIPPGNNVYDNSNFWLPKEQAEFLRLVKNYQSTIKGILTSHTHSEELKVIVDNTSQKIIGGVYFTAALSTCHANAPSVKTFYFSDKSGQWVLDNYETYHFIGSNKAPIFSKLYDYNSEYCSSSDKNDLANCLSRVTADKMKTYYSAGNPNFGGTIKFPGDIIVTAQ